MRKSKKGILGRKKQDISGFFTRERKARGREREKRKGVLLLSTIYGDQSGRISSGQELKLIYLARAMRGHRNQGVSMQFQISNFREVKIFEFRKCLRDFLEFLLHLKR